MINELISNSLKYGFPDNRSGEISVEFKQRNDQLIITVADNGVGIPDDIDWRETTSLGFQLIRTLVEDQLEGHMEKQPGPGTSFEITISRQDSAEP